MRILAFFLFLLFVHWIADFVLQSHWMATNKSKSNKALSLHVGTYTSALLLAVCGAAAIGLAPLSVGASLVFATLNGALHWATDYVTSRITSRLYAAGRTHDFFVVVGADQLLHSLTLAATLWLLAEA